MARPAKVIATSNAAEDPYHQVIAELLEAMEFVDIKNRRAQRYEAAKEYGANWWHGVLVGLQMVSHRRWMFASAAFGTYALFYGTGWIHA